MADSPNVKSEKFLDKPLWLLAIFFTPVAMLLGALLYGVDSAFGHPFIAYMYRVHTIGSFSMMCVCVLIILYGMLRTFRN